MEADRNVNSLVNTLKQLLQLPEAPTLREPLATELIQDVANVCQGASSSDELGTVMDDPEWETKMC